jgi:alpha-L-fucosidase
MARAGLAARFLLITAGVTLALQVASDHGARATTPGSVQPAEPARAATSPAADTRMDWWRKARFGMFIHWGLYAVPAGEWQGRTDYGEWIRHNARIPIDEYDRFRRWFSPSRFDPAAWVRLARQAGMKYIVITTKHHDGFCLFDSKETDFDVMSTSFGRDIMRALALACAKEGITICWYYSIMDWHHPDYLPRRDWESRPTEGADFERMR